MRISDWSSDVCSSDLEFHWYHSLARVLCRFWGLEWSPGRSFPDDGCREPKRSSRLGRLQRDNGGGHHASAPLCRSADLKLTKDRAGVQVLAAHIDPILARSAAPIVRDRKSTRLNSSH